MMNNYLAQTPHIDHSYFAGADARLSGCISEIRYRSESPMLLNALLLPLLQQLGQQSRWQLWLSPMAKISRKWLAESGLPVAKSVQLSCTEHTQRVNATLRALSSGNFSIVVAWFISELTESEKIQLEIAANEGKCTAIILLPKIDDIANQTSKPDFNSIKCSALITNRSILSTKSEIIFTILFVSITLEIIVNYAV